MATVGRLEVEPGAENVIPTLVRLTVDARAPDPERFEALIGALGLKPHYRVEPVALAEAPRAALRAELEALGLPAVELASGAGHDAGILAAAGVDVGDALRPEPRRRRRATRPRRRRARRTSSSRSTCSRARFTPPQPRRKPGWARASRVRVGISRVRLVSLSTRSARHPRAFRHYAVA